MVPGFCFVPGCSTGYKTDRKRCEEEGKKVKALFKPPNDAVTFEAWKRLIPRKDKELTRKSMVCELHFLDEDIDRCFITMMPDGTINKIERERYGLKPSAVPLVFPNLPKYLSNFRTKRKLPMERTAVEVKKPSKLPVFRSKVVPNSRSDATFSNCELHVNKGNSNIVKRYGKKPSSGTIQEMDQQIYSIKEEPVSEVQEMGKLKEKHDANIRIQSSYSLAEETVSDFEVQEIKEDPEVDEEIQPLLTAEKISVPNEWWSVSSTPKFIVCAKWDASYACERKVIIEEDLNVKLFIKESEKLEEDDLKLSSIEEVSSLLCKIDQYSICPGIDLWKEKCLKYQKDRASSRPSPWCINCRRERKLLLHRIYWNSEQRKEAKLKEYKRRFKNVMKQNKRLRKKVERLTNRMKFLMDRDQTYDCSKIKNIDVNSDIDDIENEINMELDDDLENTSNVDSDNDDEYISSIESEMDDVENIESQISTSEMVANVPSDSDKVHATQPTSHAKNVQITTKVASSIDNVKNVIFISADSKKVGNANQNQSVISTSDISKAKGVICNSKTGKVKHDTHVASGNMMVGNIIQNQTVIAEIYIKP